MEQFHAREQQLELLQSLYQYHWVEQFLAQWQCLQLLLVVVNGAVLCSGAAVGAVSSSVTVKGAVLALVRAIFSSIAVAGVTSVSVRVG